MEERSYTTTYNRLVVVTNSTMAITEDRTQSLWTMATTHGLISGNNGGNGGAKLVGEIIQSKIWTISGGYWAGNDDNGANSGRGNLVVANSVSYGRSMAATEFAMVTMEWIMEEWSYTTTYGRSMVVTSSTMEATEERTQSLRIVVATHRLINGNNGGQNGVKLVGAIIQRKLLPISGGNWAGNDNNVANSGSNGGGNGGAKLVGAIIQSKLNNFEEFLSEFKACFGVTTNLRTTINKIRRLRQGDRPASAYATDFCLLASDIP